MKVISRINYHGKEFITTIIDILTSDTAPEGELERISTKLDCILILLSELSTSLLTGEQLEDMLNNHSYDTIKVKEV